MKIFLVTLVSAIIGAAIFGCGLVCDSFVEEMIGLLFLAPCIIGFMFGDNNHGSCWGRHNDYHRSNPDDYLDNYASLDWWENSKKHPTDLLENESHKKSR